MMSGDIESVLKILKQFKRGYFTLMDESGDQFVIARKEEFENQRKGAAEEQLSLPQSEPLRRDSSVSDVWDKINREIALYQVQRGENEGPEPAEDDLAIRPQRRIKFEPLKGDLPPELQED